MSYFIMKGQKDFAILLSVLGTILFYTGCTSTMPLTIYDDLPEGNTKGYVEFYCTYCLASLAIFRLEDEKEIHITNFVTGRSVESTIKMSHGLYRLKRLRIAQPPGDYIYMVKILSPVLEGSTSIKFNGKVMQDALTPIRVEYHQYAHKSFKWGAIAGNPLPLKPSPTALESLNAAFDNPDWGTRWYAAEALGLIGVIDSAVSKHLQELSGKDAYQQCKEKEDADGCSLVREQAARVLKMLNEKKP